MMRVLLLAAAAMAKYEECHLYRSAVIARERGHDVRSLLRKLRLQQAEMAYLRTWAATAGASYLPLQYDELRRDPVGVVSRIYAFLGVEAHATRPDLYARSMRKPLHEYVENLDEVREALRGTPWAADPVLTA